jgi:hypothetical protein
LLDLRILRASFLALSVCCSVVASADSPAEILRTCAAKADPDARGLASFATSCPGIASALADLGYPKMLPADWQERIDRKQLADLSALTSRYQLATSRPPGVDSVKAVVQQLGLERTSLPKTWWERFKDWFRSWFESRNDRDLSWIDRWLDRLHAARGVFTFVTFAFVTVVLIAAIVFVVKELRSGGILRSKEIGRRRLADQPSPAHGSADGLDRAPLLEQPALLLAALVQRLTLEGHLTAERHLTHRELPRAVRLNAPGQRERLAGLASVAETLLPRRIR